MQYHEEQRALGFPVFKEYIEAQRANGWLALRERHHAELLRDIEAANKRKLAEDPTFIPTPLPELESRLRRGKSTCEGHTMSRAGMSDNVGRRTGTEHAPS